MNIKMEDWYQLSGQTAVVTGGATGLGLAITRCLVAAGAKVVVISSSKPEKVTEALAEFGERVSYYSFDMQEVYLGYDDRGL